MSAVYSFHLLTTRQTKVTPVSYMMGAATVDARIQTHIAGSRSISFLFYYSTVDHAICDDSQSTVTSNCSRALFAIVLTS